MFLDPHDPAVVAAARAAGIPEDWIDAAQRSPIWDLIMTYEVALPLHPEYRTMPMVWYIPPLSPVVDVLRDTGHDGEDVGNLFGAVDALRIPVEYLAGLFTAGDPAPVTAVLRRLAAMRAYQRRINLGEERDESIAAAVGMTGQQIDDMYRLLAIAKYEERYVIPAAHAEDAHRLEELGTECSLDYEGGPGMGGSGPFGEVVRAAGTDRGGELPHAAQPADRRHVRRTRRQEPRRVNLLNWDGKGTPGGAVPRPQRRRRRSMSVPHLAAVAARAASLLLRYPDADVLDALPTRAGRPDGCRPASLADPLRRSPAHRRPANRPGSPRSTSSCSTSAAAAACT